MARNAARWLKATEAGPDPRLRLQRLAIFAGVVAVYVWSARGTHFSVGELVRGWPNILDFLSRTLPPNTGVIWDMIRPLVETIQISIWGTTLAAFLSIPLGILAARNVSPHPALYQASRLVLNALRSTSELIFALIFVAAVGLGPFPGVLALAMHSAGMLGKFYAEAIENIDPGPVEALEATGAHRLQVLAFAVLPQIVPEFITYTLYRWEHNLRQATVLGFVGAGGIGFELITSMRLFKYQDTTMILLLILATVTVMDFFSTKLRERVI